MEKTLVIFKPDAVQRGLVGEIMSRFEKKGLKIVALEMRHLDDTIVSEHYKEHREKYFYNTLKKFIQAAPVVLMTLEGLDCVAVVRSMVGKTNGREANNGTIRSDYSMSTSYNCIHASASVDEANEEIKRFFDPSEVMDYTLLMQEYTYAMDELEGGNK